MTTPASRLLRAITALSATAALGLSAAHAGDVIKGNNTTNLNLDGSWISAQPTASDVAVWDNTVTAANTTALGGNLSWQGIRIANPTGNVTISTGNTLTLGTAGIDMSAASVNLTLNPSITIGGDQTWSVASGRTLTIGTTNTLAINNALNLTGPGTFTFSKAATGTGAVTLNSGILNMNVVSNVTGFGALTINGGTLTMPNSAAQSLSNSAYNLNGDFTIDPDARTLSFNTGAVVLGGNRTITVTRGTGVFAQAVGDGGNGYSLTKAGATALVLQSTATYTGATVINAGTLHLGGSTGTGSTITGPTAGGSLDTASLITLGGGTLQFNRTNAVVQGTDFSGSAITGTGNFTHNGSADLTLNAANTFSGGSTTVSSTGNLTLTNALAVQNSTLGRTSTGDIIFDNGAGTAWTVGGLGGNKTLSFLTSTGSAIGLTISGNGSAANNSGNITGIGTTITKNGANTQTFSGTGANTYTGLTTVSAGGLTLNKTAGIDAIASNVLVNGTGTLTSSASNQINDAANVEIAAGTWALGTTSETVNGVKLTGGAITGTGTNNLTSTTAYDLQSGSSSKILAGSVGATKTTSGNVTLSGANTFTGGLTVTNGTVIATASGSALGNGTVTLGDTSGTNAASLIVGTTGLTFGNAIVLATNPTVGTLNVGVSGNFSTTFTGGVTGTNNLSINSQGTQQITFSTNLINNTGTVTNASTGTIGNAAGNIISGGIGSNVTGIIQNSATGAMTVSGNLAVNSGGTTLTNTAGGKSLFVTGNVTGTGNLILNNNSSLASGISISGTSGNVTNMAGSITNSGTGTGSSLISAVIGTNVTGVTQSSATSNLTLSGANTYTGATNISAGTLTISNAATFTNTSAINLTGTGRLDVNVANQSLSKLNTGTSGVVAAGTFLRLSATQAAAGAGNGPGTIAGTLELNAATIAANYVVSLDTDSTVRTLINSAFTPTSTNLLGNSTFDFGATTGASIANGISTSTAGAKVLTVTGTAGTASTSGVISGAITDGSGSLSLVKTGAGRVNLTNSAGTSLFTGGVTIKEGTLGVEADGNTPTAKSAAGSGTITLGDSSGSANATLTYLSGAKLITNAITVANGTTGNTLAISSAATTGSLFGGGITMNHDLVLQNTSTGGSTIQTGGITNNGNKLTVNNTSTAGWTISSNMTGSGALEQNSSGSGALTLSGTNTGYTGAITIASGTLTALGANSLGAATGVAALTNNGTLTLGSSALNVNYGGGEITLNNGSTLNFNQGPGASQSGNTTTGKISVAAAATTAIRFGSGSTNNQVGFATNGFDIGAGATVNHTIVSGSQTNIVGSATSVVTLLGNATVSVTSNNGVSNLVNYAKGVTESGGTNFSLTKEGTGILMLGASVSGPAITGAASGYTGTTTVNAGTLRIGIADSLPDTALAVNTGATFDMSAFGYNTTSATYNQRVLGLNDGTGGGGTVTGNSINLANSANIGNRTLTLDGTTGSYAFSGVIQNKPSANVTANSVLSLTKSGGSTQILSGNNTYSGGTTVTLGTLKAGSDTAFGTGGVTINGGKLDVGGFNLANAITVTSGTVTGTGTLNADLALNGLSDVLSPGNSPGILSLGVAQTWSSFTYDWEVNDFDGTVAGTSFDQIAIAGGLTLSGSSNSIQLNVIGLDALNAPGLVPDFAEINRSWTIVSSDTAISGFDAAHWNINTASFGSPFTGTWSVALNDKNIDLVYTTAAIPEPSGYATLAGMGMIGFALYRRRRSAK